MRIKFSYRPNISGSVFTFEAKVVDAGFASRVRTDLTWRTPIHHVNSRRSSLFAGHYGGRPQKMSKIEAAASLFGSSDSGSDFFTAPEGGDSRKESPSPSTNEPAPGAVSNQDFSSLFGSVPNAGDATSLFSGSESKEDLFGDSSEPSTDATAASVHRYGEHGGFDESYAANRLDGHTSTETQYSYDQQGWDAQNGQWNGYAQYEPTQAQGTRERTILPNSRAHSLQVLRATIQELPL